MVIEMNISRCGLLHWFRSFQSIDHFRDLRWWVIEPNHSTQYPVNWGLWIFFFSRLGGVRGDTIACSDHLNQRYAFYVPDGWCDTARRVSIVYDTHFAMNITSLVGSTQYFQLCINISERTDLIVTGTAYAELNPC